jgi:parallel beta-helix repeat protein
MINKNGYLLTICVILLLIISLSGCNEKNNSLKNTIIVGHTHNADYSSIRTAISNANENDIILISEGVYKEVIVLNKTLTLKPRSGDHVVLTYNGSLNGSNIILINQDNCVITGFIIKNSENESNIEGIKIYSNNNHIYNNTITNNKYGIHIEEISKYNNISKNIIKDNYQGIWLYQTRENVIYQNIIINNSDVGIKAKGSISNIIRRNNFSHNFRGIYFCCGSFENIMYENSFILNSETHVKGSSNNIWFYENTGNYWDDYKGLDNNNDNIGDSPYLLEGGVATDQFPLYEKLI